MICLWFGRTVARSIARSKFLMTPVSRNSHKRLELKENQTKYRNMTRKPRSHFRILIYRAWAKANSRTVSYKLLNNRLLSITFQQLALVVLPDEFPKYHFSLSPLLRERNCLDIVPLIHCFFPCILPLWHDICSSD